MSPIELLSKHKYRVTINNLESLIPKPRKMSNLQLINVIMATRQKSPLHPKPTTANGHNNVHVLYSDRVVRPRRSETFEALHSARHRDGFPSRACRRSVGLVLVLVVVIIGHVLDGDAAYAVAQYGRALVLAEDPGVHVDCQWRALLAARYLELLLQEALRPREQLDF